MAERDKAKDRPSGHQSSSSGSGAYSFLPAIFGRRPTPAPPSTSRAHATYDGKPHNERSTHRDPLEEMISPKGKLATLPVAAATATRESSPRPFHLDSAIALMKDGTESTAELCEIVKATAVWMANLLVGNEDIFSTQVEATTVKAEDITTLYGLATNFADPKADPALRVAAIRLLAALIATAPPSLQSPLDGSGQNIRTLYSLIICPSAPTDPPSIANAVFVEVGALKALTQDGVYVSQLEGLVGWLVRSLEELQEEWVVWCCQKSDRSQDWGSDAVRRIQPFTPITPATPAEAASSIIELITSIISNHVSLFSPSDLRRIIQPMLDFLYAGVAAPVSSSDDKPQPISGGNASRHGSPAASTLSSPIQQPSSTIGFGALGLEATVRQSVSTGSVSRRGTTSIQGTPGPRPAAKQPSVESPVPFSPGPHNTTSQLRWPSVLPSVVALFNLLLIETAIDDTVFDMIVICACLTFDHGNDTDVHGMPHSATRVSHDLFNVVLGPKAGRRGELKIRELLEGTLLLPRDDYLRKVDKADLRVTCGAVLAARHILDNNRLTRSLSSLVPSLLSARSSRRFPLPEQAEERAIWYQVDHDILLLLRDHLQAVAEGPGGGEEGGMDAWTEGEAACELLDGLRHLALTDAGTSSLSDEYAFTLQVLPKAIGHLHASSSSSPTFYHPKYIELLLGLQNIDEAQATVVLDYYQEQCLCFPFTSDWIANIWKLLKAFSPAHTSRQIRSRLVSFLLNEVYAYAEDLPEHRIELVHEVIVPFLEEVLLEETEGKIVDDALRVLVNAAVSETMERDEERRKHRAAKALHEVQAEDAAPLPNEEQQQADFVGSFHRIRSLIAKLAAQTPCDDGAVQPTANPAPVAVTSPQASTSVDSASSDLKRSNSRAKESSSLRGLIGSLSPPMSSNKTNQLPSIATLTSSLSPDPSEMSPSRIPVAAASHDHSACRSLLAVVSLIAIFTRLAFSPPQSMLSTAAAPRTPASARSITIYRDLLGLLYPMTDDQRVDQSPKAPSALKIPAHCPKARVVILQWLMRLRADPRHRIYLRVDIDHIIAPYAAILKRTVESEHEARTGTDDSTRKQTRSSARDTADDRGISARVKETTVRSRSRSKQPAILRGADHNYNPLWTLPEHLVFEVPPDTQPSEGLLTYDPNHPSLKDKDAPPVEGVWLPVSEYVRVLNGILRGHDWELVSYILCFLPLQLSNKLFFHGGRATKEVRALLEVLCDGVLGVGGQWEKRFNVPVFIRKIDINAAAYQSLSILVSYHGVFNRQECDRLVQAFVAGLQGKGEIAKPCLQALTLSIFELEQPVGRHLLKIIEAMNSILSTTGLAVHILEFLISLGQNGSLFRNFTDEQYRLVFVVAINYIADHNARSDQVVDLSDPSKKEDYILSQHVIGLAYHSIYIWFMVLKLHQRPNLVPEITRELNKARSQRSSMDEMAEVCFDWLARYTYGNADPRPSTSFLSEMVMSDDGEAEPPKSQSWLLGGAIITITSHARTGWSTITTTRPTGSTAVVCKLENVPSLDIGEANADLVSLPAFLMANRKSSSVAEDDDSTPSAKEIVTAESSARSPEAFDPNSQHGYIWSGATPSQRRKDVNIEPSYLALQLLSSYPNINLETPRGRMIPNDEKFLRALRGIQNTPVIDTLKIAVLYVAPGQTTEAQIFSNIDGSPLYLDFLSGLGRLIRLKGQVDVFVGGLNRENDADGEYAYAWWDDLTQAIFHIPTMMPNLPGSPNGENKKRLVGNDYVKIVYNDTGKEFVFDTIRTAWNFVNIVISPHTTGAGIDELPRFTNADSATKTDEGWHDWDREDWFKVSLQRAPGIPDFGPLGMHKLVSRRSLPILVRQIAQLANDMAARFMHIRDAADAASAEYITSWRSRLRAIARLRASLPPIELPEENDQAGREMLLRDFTRSFTYRPPPTAPDKSQ